MNAPFAIEIPPRIEEVTTLALTLRDEGLIGSRKHFLRLDMYPLVSPSHKRRHYGWWDVPLQHVRHRRTELVLDWRDGTLAVPDSGNRVRLGPVWRGEIDEPGYCHVHVSIWKKSWFSVQTAALTSSFHLLAPGDLDVPLKQIRIPVTDRCNLKCTMCPRQRLGNAAPGDLPDDVLDPLVDAAPHFLSILLQGWGEPLLYPNLVPVIGRLKRTMSADAEIGLTTNAVFLTTDTAARLLDSGLDFLYFSVDGATKETYEAIRVGSVFDLVIGNISRCVARRRMMGTHGPRFMLNLVMQEANLAEIPRYVELAAKLGVESVSFSFCVENSTGKVIVPPEERLLPLFDEARTLAGRNGVTVSFPPTRKNEVDRCLRVERAIVLNNGDVIPCLLMMPGYGRRVRMRGFGNVRNTPLTAIWESAEFRQFRQQVLAGNFPPECKGCGAREYQVC